MNVAVVSATELDCGAETHDGVDPLVTAEADPMVGLTPMRVVKSLVAEVLSRWLAIVEDE
jgi:hypothetical protein